MDEVWQGFDPSLEPLEVAIEKEWTQNGIRYKQIRFTAETINGHKILSQQINFAIAKVLRWPAGKK